jgi:threonine dehydrogenase-like Zn-dependent dehydrogenase
MRALCWHGIKDVRVDTVPDPKIQEPTDVIIKITSTAICGSDLHLYDGFMMGMEKGDVLGHEPMGIVVEVGSLVRKLKKGDRVSIHHLSSLIVLLLRKRQPLTRPFVTRKMGVSKSC